MESSFWLLRLVFISMTMLFIEFMVFSISAWPTPFSNYSKYCIIYYLCMSKRNKSPLFSQFISQFWSIQLLLLPLPTFSFQSSQYPDWCQWKSCFQSHILSKTFIKHQFGARWKKMNLILVSRKSVCTGRVENIDNDPLIFPKGARRWKI